MNDVNLPKTTRGRETLKKICKAAEKLFSAKGYYNTSINDIAYEAEVAPGTFYIYFKDKKSVFRYLVQDLSRSLRKEIRTAAKNCKNRYEIEYIGFKTFFDFVKRHRGLYKIIWEAQFVDEELFREYYEDFAKRYIRRIKEAQERDEIKNIDAKSLAYCFIGITNFIGLKWIIFDNEPVTEDVIENIMKFVKDGAFK